MDENKKPPITSREEIQGFFEEDQKIEDELKLKNVVQAGLDARKGFNSADISHLIYSSNREFWDWWCHTTSPNIHEKEVIPGGGGVVKGSGSKSKGKKDKKGNKVYVDPWSGI
ncbi:MAG: hypothetical protein NC238_02940 [Dehalobacter sp.]|nr:hypothetical protein [Dehalobacter sp.]